MSTIFTQLAKNLSSEEKKALLAKINTSLNFEFKDIDSIITDKPTQKNQDRLRQELTKLGFFRQLFLKIMAFVENKQLPDVFLEKELIKSRKILRASIPQMVQFPRNSLTPVFAQKIFDLYTEVSFIKPVFDYVFQQRGALETGILNLFEAHFPQALRRLTDIFSLDDMELFYKKDTSKKLLFDELDLRLEKYLSSVPQDVLHVVKEQIKPFYYLKSLVNYPYIFLFDQFGVKPLKDDFKKYPPFSSASFQRCSEYLERLYYGLYLAQKVTWNSSNLQQTLHCLLDNADEKFSLPSLEEIAQKLALLHQIVLELVKQLPWRTLLQWSFQDPYYIIQFYLPRFSIASFYEGILETSLKNELEMTIPHVRQIIFEKEKYFLFQNQGLQPLEYYTAGIHPSAAIYRLKGFKYSQTLNLITAFLNQHIESRHTVFFQHFSHMLNQQSRNLLSPLMATLDELINVKERILKFDRALSPDSTEGKELQQVRNELSPKQTSHKSYLQLIQSNDQLAEELIQKAIGYFKTFRSQIAALGSKSIPAINSILKIPYLLGGKNEPMEQVLERLKVVVEKAILLVEESYQLESQ